MSGFKEGNCYQVHADAIVALGFGVTPHNESLNTLLEAGVAKPENIVLVHGIVTGCGSYVKGRRYGHAWLEILDIGGDDFVLDLTVDRFLPKSLYYGVGNIDPDETVSYDGKTANIKMLKHRHYGPWDLDISKTDEEEIRNEYF